MEEALVAMLLADAGVAAVLGARVNWGRRPQGAGNQPYCVLQVISQVPDYTYQGSAGRGQARVQADVYALSYELAKQAARALKARLSGFRGTRSGVAFDGIFIDDERDLPEADPGEVTNLFRTSIDFIIHHR